MSGRSIHWFRQDLRIHDNPSLLEACKFDKIFPIFILDTKNNFRMGSGEASTWWLHHSLNALNKQLNYKLSFFKGDPKEILINFVSRNNINAIFWNRCYEPWQIKRDKEIKTTFENENINIKSFNSSLLWEPWNVKKEDGSHYKVFTPFYRKGCLNAPIPRTPLKKPKNTNFLKDETTSLDLLDFCLLSKNNWHKKFLNLWEPGEKSAKIKLNKFLSKNIFSYKVGRDFPSKHSTSLLSPHIHFGEISPNQIWYDIPFENNINFDNFRSELAWREFSYSQLFFNPELPSKNLQSKFDNFPWVENKPNLISWQKGETGIPMVDAGMRQLWQTGFMHNRLRMIVGSFLVKNLLSDWRLGANWFWNSLVDADLASNSAGWQWVAGCGADAAPFFRVFNPVTQGNKFDENGKFIKKFVPELKNLPDKFLFSPWEAPSDILKEANISLDENYPNPIVNLKVSRQRALDAFKMLKK